MDEKQAQGKPKGRSLWVAGLVALLLITGFLITGWIVKRADRDMRADLLKHARLVAQGVSTERVQALIGSEADLTSPDYLRLKKQLDGVLTTNAECRGLYLMGCNPDGTVFFLVDTQKAATEISPSALPGELYPDASDELKALFTTAVPFVEGPLPDEWGVWVSALVPLTDPDTNAVIAVVGMDIDAGDWNLVIAERAALPVGLLLLLLIGGGTALAITRRVSTSPKPVLRRLLLPLAVLVVLLTVGTGTLLWQQHQQQVTQTIASNDAETARDLRTILEHQASGLATALQPIAADSSMQKALRKGDAAGLLTVWRPVFETMHSENNVTHFVFLDAKRVCLLRVHKPDKHGDRIDRFTALEAERTGKTASGIELGLLGTFTLWVVRPVFEAGTLVGYVELGKEIEDVMQVLQTRYGSQLAVCIRKEYLDREEWESGMRLLQRQPDWDRLAHYVVSYYSQGCLPNAFATWADRVLGTEQSDKKDHEFDLGGEVWRVAKTPLQEASGREVGDLLFLDNITADKVAFTRLLVLASIIAGVVLALLLGYILVLLARTDAAIRAQQRELRESEERHRLLFDQSWDALMTLAPPSWKFTSGNPAAYKLFGIQDEAEFTSLGPWDLAPELQPDGLPSAEKAKNHIETAMREGSHYFEWTHRHLSNGTDFPATVLLTRMEQEGQVFLQATVRDNTAQKRAEEALRERDVFLTDLLDTIPIPVFYKDQEGRYLGLNKAFMAFLGESREHLLGKTVFEVNPTELAAVFHAKDLELMERRGLQQYEAQVMDASGVMRDVIFYKAALTTSQGDLNGLVGAILDITERKQAQEVLSRSHEELERRVTERTAQLLEANKELEAFAYSVSHDLRAPLRTLNGFSSILLKSNDEALDEQSRRYLDLIGKGALRMDRLVSGLLEYARTSQEAMEPDWCYPEVLVQELLEGLGTRYPTATLQIEPLPRCWADLQLLQQVWQNLLDNALKFSSTREVAVVQVGGWREGNELIYFVKDNGEGFDPSYTEKLFKVFQRLHTDEQFEGIGIGLAIVGSLIGRHGGRVWAESSPGEGATFFFSLPVVGEAGED